MNRLAASRWLLVCWLAIIGVDATVLLAQSLSDAFGKDADIAWSWMFTIFTAPFSLVVATAFSEPTGRWKTAKASRFRFLSALGSSILLGVGALLALVAEPFVGVRNFEILQATVIPLTLVQGVVVAAVSSVIFEGR